MISYSEIVNYVIKNPHFDKATQIRSVAVLLDAQRQNLPLPSVNELDEKGMFGVVWTPAGGGILGIDIWCRGDCVAFWHEWHTSDGLQDEWEYNEDTNQVRRMFFERVVAAYSIA